jgi:hypothetical protein
MGPFKVAKSQSKGPGLVPCGPALGVSMNKIRYKSGSDIFIIIFIYFFLFLFLFIKNKFAHTQLLSVKING